MDNSLLGQCPACGSRDIAEKSGVSGGFCEDCGLVHDGDGWASDRADTVSSEAGNEEKSSGVSDWSEAVSIQDASDQQLVTLLKLIEEASEKLQLSDEDRNQAADFVTVAWKQNITHGRKFENMVAASIYAACRESGRAIPSTAVAKAVGTSKESLQTAYRVLTDHLDVEIDPPGPSGYLSYLANEVGLSQSTARSASESINDSRPIGGNPAGIAGASLYLCNAQKKGECSSLTLQDVAQAAEVTKETIWRKTQELE